MVKLKVEYVGLKDRETDHLYGTGITWVGKGDIHDVPADAWEGMKNHPDVWRLAAEQYGAGLDRRASAPAPVPVSAPAAPKPQWPLRDDGPTLEEFVAAGFDANDYPPPGHAVREARAPAPSPQEQPEEKPTESAAKTPLTADAELAAAKLPTLEQAAVALEQMTDDQVIALGVEKGLGKNTQPNNMRRKLAVILSTPQAGG